jgi:formate hydrogenlyase subunit 3/multisubunit Na+/H+ antiporter MnhD subunit
MTTARSTRGGIALGFLIIAGFIATDMFSSTFVITNGASDYNYGIGLSVIGVALAVSVALFTYNIFTYRK